MRTTKIIHIVSCHAAGEVGDVIVGGVAPPPGATVLEQAQFIAKDRQLRDFVLNEPRGGVFRHVNLLLPPKNPEAAFGWIIMEPEDTPPMSGSNAICVATVLLETGIVPMVEPVTEMVLEAPGGLVRARVSCSGGRAELVTLRNVPAFVDSLDIPVEVEGLGTLTVDVAYGGDSFAIVDARKLGFALVPDEARELATTGVKITKAVNQQYRFDRSGRTNLTAVSFCQLAAPIEESDGVLTGVSAVAIRPAKIDRSPCGTGCSARMAVLNSRGLLKPRQRFVGRSIMGSKFLCEIEEEILYKGAHAIVPSIAGTAWLTGTHQHMLDPSDPWPGGYRLSDTWPKVHSE